MYRNNTGLRIIELISMNFYTMKPILDPLIDIHSVFQTLDKNNNLTMGLTTDFVTLILDSFRFFFRLIVFHYAVLSFYIIAPFILTVWSESYFRSDLKNGTNIQPIRYLLAHFLS